MVLISWIAGAVASLLGLWVSYVGDLVTGPMIVCSYGALLIVAGIVRKVWRAEPLPAPPR
jgi:ABC-type Mn2+/Zn2+ transport system permease subunit